MIATHLVPTPDSALDASNPEASELAIFHEQWQIFRKAIDHNYFNHREAYGWLRRILIDEVARPFRFLDLGCGDASAAVEALAGLPVAHYHGIDRSPTALDLARRALLSLGCPVTLEQGDFVDALADRPSPADVVWCGLALHHLQAPAKLAAMRAIRGVVGQHGFFLCYEQAGPDGEDRAAWLRRAEQQRPSWPAFTPAEWAALVAHARAADFPEQTSRWRDLGREAGFGTVREVFVAPSDLARMYCFRA